MPVAAPRRGADGDEHRVGIADGVRKMGAEGQASGPHVVGHEAIEARLVDRDLAPAEPLDLSGFLVDARHVVPELCEAGSGHQSHVAGTDHGDAHGDQAFSKRPRRARVSAAVSARCSATATLASRKPMRLPQS